MAVIISDTGPLNYLIMIREISVLPKLFDRVIVPTPVLVELQHERTPLEVKEWIGSMPSWVTIESPDSPKILAGFSERLGKGELSAMAVALQKNLPILMDDREAREVAQSLDLTTFGTLAILEAAAARGWLDFRISAEALRISGFYITDTVIEKIARRL